MKTKILMVFIVLAASQVWALDESVPEVRERMSNGWWQVACHKPGTNGNERTYRAYSFGDKIDWDWRDVREVGPGTKLIALATQADGKPNKIYAVRVDLQTPRLDIVGSLRCVRQRPISWFATGPSRGDWPGRVPFSLR